MVYKIKLVRNNNNGVLGIFLKKKEENQREILISKYRLQYYIRIFFVMNTIFPL